MTMTIIITFDDFNYTRVEVICEFFILYSSLFFFSLFYFFPKGVKIRLFTFSFLFFFFFFFFFLAGLPNLQAAKLG